MTGRWGSWVRRSLRLGSGSGVRIFSGVDGIGGGLTSINGGGFGNDPDADVGLAAGLIHVWSTTVGSKLA